MKRLLAFLLAMVMVLGLVACGQQTPNANAPAADDDKPAADAPAADDKPAADAPAAEHPSGLEYVELDWFTSEALNWPDGQMVIDALCDYALEKLNLKLNVTVVPYGEYHEKLLTMLQAGEPLGIAHVSDTYYSNARQGMYYPIDELFDEYGVGTKSLFSEGVWDCLTVNDHIYCTPTLKDNAYITGYAYNERLANELGIVMENEEWDSLDDLEEALMEAKVKRDELHPEWADKPLTTEFTWMTIPSAFGAECFLGLGSPFAVCNVPGIDDFAGYDNDTVFNVFETEEYKEFCLMMQRLVEAGVCAYDYTELATLAYEPYCLFSLSNWGFTWMDKGNFGDQVDTKLVVFDDRIWTDSSNYYSAGYVIPANCPNPERAMMFIEMMNTDPYAATLMRFGIEGVHYTYDENGEMTFEGTRNEDVTNPGYLFWMGADYGNVTIVNAPASYVGPNKEFLTGLIEANNNAKLPKHMGIVVDTSKITNELAACNSVVGEFDYNLMYGKYESQEAVLEALDAFNQKLKDNGLDTIIAEVQAQVDAFNAQK